MPGCAVHSRAVLLLRLKQWLLLLLLLLRLLVAEAQHEVAIAGDRQSWLARWGGM